MNIEGTARYAGLLLASAEGFGLRPRLFTLFVPMLGHSLCSVVTSASFNSNLSNFENHPKNLKKLINLNKKKIKKKNK